MCFPVSAIVSHKYTLKIPVWIEMKPFVPQRDIQSVLIGQFDFANGVVQNLCCFFKIGSLTQRLKVEENNSSVEIEIAPFKAPFASKSFGINTGVNHGSANVRAQCRIPERPDISIDDQIDIKIQDFDQYRAARLRSF